MNNLNKKKLSGMLISIVLLSGCSSSYATESGKIATQNYGNVRKIKKIVQTSEKLDISKIKKSIPGIEVIRLSNGRYAIISNNLNENELKKKLSKLKEIERIENPKNIGIVKPIIKVPVQNNFTLPETISNSDKIVNDPGYKAEWDISYTESNKAWSLIQQKREVKVAVLDTGIDYNHPDLKNRVLTELGYDFVNNDNNPMDDNGHGTHVSGIIAAEANNHQGITGIAGPLDVKIIPIKVLDANGQGEADVIAKGIEYAADKGADIINLSFGCNEKNIDIENAIQYAKSKGVFIVAAAGNDNRNCDNSSPAGDAGVYTVAAINQQYAKASFSDYGSSVKISSPGVRILSTVPGGKYEAWDGTSMAAPVVSGVAALVKAENPSLTPDQIENVLDQTAVDIKGKGRNNAIGYGLIDAYRAIQKVKSMES